MLCDCGHLETEHEEDTGNCSQCACTGFWDPDEEFEEEEGE